MLSFLRKAASDTGTITRPLQLHTGAARELPCRRPVQRGMERNSEHRRSRLWRLRNGQLRWDNNRADPVAWPAVLTYPHPPAYLARSCFGGTVRPKGIRRQWTHVDGRSLHGRDSFLAHMLPPAWIESLGTPRGTPASLDARQHDCRAWRLPDGGLRNPGGTRRERAKHSDRGSPRQGQSRTTSIVPAAAPTFGLMQTPDCGGSSAATLSRPMLQTSRRVLAWYECQDVDQSGLLSMQESTDWQDLFCTRGKGYTSIAYMFSRSNPLREWTIRSRT